MYICFYHLYTFFYFIPSPFCELVRFFRQTQPHKLVTHKQHTFPSSVSHVLCAGPDSSFDYPVAAAAGPLNRLQQRTGMPASDHLVGGKEDKQRRAGHGLRKDEG